MDKAIVFHDRRLLVGWRLTDWSEVWYEPVGSADGEEVVYDTNGGAEIGLYKLSVGAPGYREPMFGEIAWFAPFDPETFQAKKKAEKEALQQQFMADAYKYLSADNRRAEKHMEKDFHRLHDTRWFKFFEALKLYKNCNRQARPSTRTAATATAEQEQEEALSEDSGFASNIGPSTRSPAGTEMPPPPPPTARSAPARNLRTGSSSDISRKRKRHTQSQRSKAPKANPRAPRHQGDEAAQSFDAEDSFSRNTPRQISVPLMSGALGSEVGIISPRIMADSSSRLPSRHSNNLGDTSTEDDEYDDDHGFGRQPSANTRDESVAQDHFSNGFPSSVDYGGYNDGLDDEEALERAKRESAAPESRTDLATGYEDGISTTNGRLPEGVYESIEVEDEQDKS
ncbi:hypothetical protein KC343_g1644 [Hortaea werneckii]|uniref:Uncharacterized protein n=1 Tax=Hortaea werneckii TaxID=91943 RepID=A0A3M7F2R3_HORWE|nr:hypothetical protein KC352_g13941 [Hortaea werneckii]KAI7570226.1 hypothetical protein KC317_g2644 [Hortaea werneckii]KAI7625835.1 hypothetical protein KC346_g1558 [Hortaea werneckii]KAI7635736.1 hypothetical protein KC343_g1644 [Hortaea werneckii]KAI7670407.1 hypothetical protein KC319_g5891 [Hortaea werneckii]